MSRSGYSDDCDNWQLIKWRGAVNSAIRGKRGQKLLRELADAMDAMPVKVLIAERLESSGYYCALGAVGAKRGLDIQEIDPENHAEISRSLDIAEALAKEIAFINDDDFAGGYKKETPEHRWTRVRNWVTQHIKKDNT